MLDTMPKTSMGTWEVYYITQHLFYSLYSESNISQQSYMSYIFTHFDFCSIFFHFRESMYTKNLVGPPRFDFVDV